MTSRLLLLPPLPTTHLSTPLTPTSPPSPPPPLLPVFGGLLPPRGGGGSRIMQGPLDSPFAGMTPRLLSPPRRRGSSVAEPFPGFPRPRERHLVGSAGVRNPASQPLHDSHLIPWCRREPVDRRIAFSKPVALSTHEPARGLAHATGGLV